MVSLLIVFLVTKLYRLRLSETLATLHHQQRHGITVLAVVVLIPH